MTTPINDQPPPVPNDRPAVWDLVIEDMRSRDQTGLSRYGTRLQPHNGRDALVDGYQEALDLCVYLRQAIEELASPIMEDRATTTCERAELMLDQLATLIHPEGGNLPVSIHAQAVDMFRTHLEAECAEAKKVALGLAERVKQQSELLTAQVEKKCVHVLAREYLNSVTDDSPITETMDRFDAEMKRRNQ